MKFGIHSLLFSETFTDRELPLLDKAKEMGFDAMDIVPNLREVPGKAGPAARKRTRFGDHNGNRNAGVRQYDFTRCGYSGCRRRVGHLGNGSK